MAHKPFYSVVACSVLDGYKLDLTFEDGSRKIFDGSQLLSSPLYAPLRDYELFRKAEILCGGVSWTAEIDINPEYLYSQGTVLS
ncbi:MAG: DUF2442 domain-containing protein [Synergistaceae bacterium]|nr:DUF2442 domain-containing protein [Synergistaceae bacterium]